MSRVEVRPFAAADVPAAAVLLAERHRRHRFAQPMLPARYEYPESAATAIEAALAGAAASGAVAVDGGRVVGYLLGARKGDELWGSNVWVEAAGQAASDPEVMRDLYAVAASRWVDEDRKAHYVLVPAADAGLVRAWFRLGFGHQHTHAIRGIPAHPLLAGGKVTVRRAVRADVPVLAQLDGELPLHQGKSPTFSAGRVSSLEERLAEWEEDIDNADYATMVAEYDGQVIGSAVGCALERSGSHTGPARPDNAGFLAFAAVLPQRRGLGAGRALGAAIINWAAESGFDSVVTDWRQTNLLSSRAWPALGFTETFVRLHRLIGY